MKGASKTMSDETTRNEIIGGMATILWGSAWGNHAEEHDCANLSGVEITEVMPDIPALALEHARRIAAQIELLNEVSLVRLYELALEADKKDPTERERALRLNPRAARYIDTAERFGECLAFMAEGAGVSWFDNHAEFELLTPYDAGTASCDLMGYAAEHCDHIPDEN